MRNWRNKKINKEIQIFKNSKNYLEKMTTKRREEIKARNYQTSKNLSFKKIKRNKKKRRRKIKEKIAIIIINNKSSSKHSIHK